MEYYCRYRIQTTGLLLGYLVLEFVLLFFVRFIWVYVLCILVALLYGYAIAILSRNIFLGALGKELDAQEFYDAIYWPKRPQAILQLQAEWYMGNYKTMVAMASAGYESSKNLRWRCLYLTCLARGYFDLGDDCNLAETVDAFDRLQKGKGKKRKWIPGDQAFQYYKAYVNGKYEQCVSLTEMSMKKIRKNRITGKLNWLMLQSNLAIAYYRLGETAKAKEICQWFVETTPKLNNFYSLATRCLEAMENGDASLQAPPAQEEKEIVDHLRKFRANIKKREKAKKAIVVLLVLWQGFILLCIGLALHQRHKLAMALANQYDQTQIITYFELEKDSEHIDTLCLAKAEDKFILVSTVSYDGGKTLAVLEIAEDIDLDTHYYQWSIVSNHYIGFALSNQKPFVDQFYRCVEFKMDGDTYWFYVDSIEPTLESVLFPEV